jgi:hypothetical protein
LNLKKSGRHIKFSGGPLLVKKVVKGGGEFVECGRDGWGVSQTLVVQLRNPKPLRK